MECHDCGKDVEHDRVYLHSKCHVGSPTWAILDQEKSELEIICSVCEKQICRFKVSPAYV